MVWLILGIVVFLGIHSVRIVAPAMRQQIIAQRGEGFWKGSYSLISIIGFVIIIWGFSLARLEGPQLFIPPVWGTHVTLLLMLFSFILLMASNLPAGRIKAATKHPMLVAIQLWAFGHLLANGDLASVILFGSFLVWSVFDRISENRRVPADDPSSKPAPAIRNDVIAIVVGAVIYVLFVWKLHLWLIGVAPVAV